MATETLIEALLRHWPAVLGVAFVAYLLSNKFNRGLNKYPGPLLASLTDWWRFWIVYKRRPEVEHIRLHEKYGTVVRLGPNDLSFSDPKALKTIYGLNKGFTKVFSSLELFENHSDSKTVRILSRSTIRSRRTSSPISIQHDIRILPRPTTKIRQQCILNVNTNPIRTIRRFNHRAISLPNREIIRKDRRSV